MKKFASLLLVLCILVSCSCASALSDPEMMDLDDFISTCDSTFTLSGMSAPSHNNHPLLATCDYGKLSVTYTKDKKIDGFYADYSEDSLLQMMVALMALENYSSSEAQLIMTDLTNSYIDGLDSGKKSASYICGNYIYYIETDAFGGIDLSASAQASSSSSSSDWGFSIVPAN